MSEKEKSKSHPFAGYLYADEEVLWMQVSAPPTWQQSMKRSLIGFCLNFVVISAIFLSLGVMAAGPNPNPDGLLKITIVACLTLTLDSLFYFILYGRYYAWLAHQPFGIVYAVTNNRLLYRRLNKIMSLSIMGADDIHILSLKGRRGTLFFGNRFPQWSHIENAAQVQQIIEQAQANL